MNKGTNKKLSHVLLVLAIFSFIITFLEGYFYYDVETYHNQLFRYMIIIQNSIKAFGFRTDISIANVLKALEGNTSDIQIFVGYAYTFATFTAPYCTLTVFYKLVEKILRIKIWNIWHRNWDYVIIFGYNDAVKALVENHSKKKKRKIHVVSENVSQSDEMELLQKGIVIHKVECLKKTSKKLNQFLQEIKISLAKYIILFEDSSAKNFSLYYLFHTDENNIELHPEVKFFCRCENDAIKKIIEDFHDTSLCEKKNDNIKKSSDLEIVSIPELKIRKMLENTPLHSYHIKKGNEDLDNWNLHLLIVGFGKLGQQLLLQAMNLGVVSSKNPILIDVVDYKIDEKKSIFSNTFADEYVTLDENEYYIASDKADGKFRIRFHKMDIRFKEFQKQLAQNGAPDKDGLYTYIAICVKDADINLHCMSEIERYLRKYPEKNSEKNVSIGVRMETDMQMASYLNMNNKTYNNVFAIEENISTITLDDLISDTFDNDAKNFHKIYSNIFIGPKKICESDSKNESPTWEELELFKRDSNRALAYHSKVKNVIYEKLKPEDMDGLFGADGEILRKDGTTWVYSGTEDEFLEKQSDTKNYPFLSEMSRLEHRRWCYFMASRGWRCTEKPDEEKDSVEKANSCLCTWDNLVKYKKEMCCYDLIPLLMKYDKESKKIGE